MFAIANSLIPMLVAINLLVFIQSLAAMKILVHSPTLSRSHMISNARVADALAQDGHDVTLLELEYMVPVGVMNASKIARQLQIPGPFFQMEMGGPKSVGEMIAEQSFKPPSLIVNLLMMNGIQAAFNAACEKFVLAESKLLKQLRDEHFDLIITEQLNFCGAGIKHLLNIPTFILLSSAPLQEHVTGLFGLPFPASYVPSLFETDMSDKMTLRERFWNLAYQLAGYYMYTQRGLDPLTGIFRQHFGADFPNLRRIVSESPFVFVAVDELVDFPRPVFPNIVYIGGLGMAATSSNASKPKMPLTEPFVTEMSKGQKGVVYFSMGSIIKSTEMDKGFLRNLFKAFAQLPEYHFIVKVEKEDKFCAELTKNMPNVFFASWAPQIQLLNHPNLRLFITHGGYNSLMEAARAGVPLISMGFFGDQYRNARAAERNGWAMAFDKRALLEDSESFRAAIRTVIEDPKYTSNAKRTQKLVLNKPFSAEERLTKSIRYLELADGKLPELLSESRHLSVVVLYNLDLLALLAVCALVFLAFCIFLALKLLPTLRRRAIKILSDHRAKMEANGQMKKAE